MYESPRRSLFTSGGVKKKKSRRQRETPTSLQESTYCQRDPLALTGRTRDSLTPECFCAKKVQKLKFLVPGSVARCGERQVAFAGEYVDGKEEGGRKGGR